MSGIIISPPERGATGADGLNAICARVYNSSDQSISNNSETALTFNTENFDTDTMHDTGSNTSRLTSTTAGKYIIEGGVEWAANVNGIRQLRLRLNGSTVIGQINNLPISASTVTRMVITTSYSLAAADYVELMAFQDSGSSLNAVAGIEKTWFAMTKQADSGVGIKQTEVDFGTTPVSEMEFTVIDNDVSPTSQLMGSIAYEAPTDKDLDEISMDMIDVIFQPGSSQFIVLVRGEEGDLADKFKINYIIG